MARSKYKKKKLNGNDYFFHKLYSEKFQTGYKYIYGKTEQELKDKIKAAEEQLQSGILRNVKTFGDAFTMWFNNVCIVDKKPGSIDRYHGTMENHIKKTKLWDAKIAAMDSMTIQEAYKELLADKRTVETIRTVHKLISPFMRYMYNNGYTIRDFSKAVILPKPTAEEQLAKIKQSDVRPMTKEEQLRFVKQIQGHHFEALYLVSIDMGLRQGESFALTWKDIDFNENTIDIYKTYKRVKNIETLKYEDLIGPPKSVKSIRKLDIPKRTGGILKAYKVIQAETLLRCGINQDEYTLVFSNQIGSFLDRTYVTRKLREQFVLCGIDKEKRFHDLRHTYATRLFELGQEPKVMQKLLGHSDLSTTMETYTHVMESMKKETVSVIDSLYDII
ncbi:MAG: site-specific integrase [Firmicutes bacterium HGW-Firmicutes-17]|jgi:integrase|nr:MAG: site-specific integrase [Firmicutes bacterium HGW-Firmicutes-17]